MNDELVNAALVQAEAMETSARAWSELPWQIIDSLAGAVGRQEGVKFVGGYCQVAADKCREAATTWRELAESLRAGPEQEA